MARDPACIPEATLRLHLARGVGPVTIRRLEEHFGSHDAVLAASIFHFGLHTFAEARAYLRDRGVHVRPGPGS